jgi:hypothetical protein
MPSELERGLSEALRGEPIAADPERRAALEQELLARLPATPPRRHGTRWACVLPTDYATQLGHRLAIVVDVEHADELDPEQIVHFVTDRYHPDELRMGVRHERTRESDDDGHVSERASMRIEIDAVGEHLDTDAMWHDLVEAFPELEGARLEDEELRGLVHGTLGGRMSQAWLDVVIDRGGVEQAKQQVIDQLRAQGVQGDPQVDIIDQVDEDGSRRREVRVMLSDEHE